MSLTERVYPKTPLDHLEHQLYKQLFWSLKRNKDKEKVWRKIDQLYNQINSLSQSSQNEMTT
jgi:hypothetical protein